MPDFDLLKVEFSADGKKWEPIGTDITWRLLRDPSNALAYGETMYWADRNEVFKVKGSSPPKWPSSVKSRVTDAKGRLIAEGYPASKGRSFYRAAGDDGRIPL